MEAAKSPLLTGLLKYKDYTAYKSTNRIDDKTTKGQFFIIIIY